MFDDSVVVIPCFNAGARVRPVVAGARAQGARVLVVDDGSTDGCTAGLAEAGARVVALGRNRGKGHALLAGLAAALEDPALRRVVLMDADGQHDPRELPGLLAAAEAQGADLLIGARVFTGQAVPWRSRFGNSVTVSVTALLLGRRLPDTQCGFRVLSRRFAEAVLAQVAGGRYETEMEMLVLGVRGGFVVGHSPIQTLYEPGNASSHFYKVRDSFLIYARLLRTAFRRRMSA